MLPAVAVAETARQAAQTTRTTQSVQTVQIDIVGVDEALEEQVRSYLGEPATADPAARAAFRRRAPARVQESLEAVGYYNAEIEVRAHHEETRWRLVILIDPGEPVRIRTVNLHIHGEAAHDPAFAGIEERMPIRTGEIFHHGRYATARRMVQNLALERGYFDGRFTVRRVDVDLAENAADIHLYYASGPRYRFGAVEFADSPLADAFLQRMVPFSPGEAYTAAQIGQLNRSLRDSGYFREVGVRPVPEAGEPGEVPVEVQVQPLARHEITTGVGYTTDWGARVRLGWERPWVNPWGHSLGVESEIAERRQSVSGRYTIPLQDPLRTALEFQLGAQAQNVADIDSEQVTASVRHRHRLDNGWQQVLSVRSDWERFRLDGERETTLLVLPGASWSRTRSRGGLDPRHGDRQMLSLEAAETWLLSDIQLYRARAGTRWVRTWPDRHRWVWRADVGALTTDAFAQVPPSLRFYAGGDQSVRGYKLHSIGPERDGTIIGGRYMAVTSLEYGYQLTSQWRPALFVDAGNAVRSWSDLSDEYKVGAGAGIRWSSPIGPVRFDVAVPIDDDDHDSWRIHFSMGSEL
ncbi:outer membrane protein assembly factor [Halorhodospira abdelmalekii]|nr:outer membrane protein assembly factor [Halorhodospira abdelmalekii]